MHVTQAELRFVRELAKQRRRMLADMRFRAALFGVEDGKYSLIASKIVRFRGRDPELRRLMLSIGNMLLDTTNTPIKERRRIYQSCLRKYAKAVSALIDQQASHVAATDGTWKAMCWILRLRWKLTKAVFAMWLNGHVALETRHNLILAQNAVDAMLKVWKLVGYVERTDWE